MRREVFICLLLAGITLGLYWPATRCDFVHFDDQVYVTENAHLKGGLSLANIEWAFSTPVSSNWHPLTMLSLMLDCQLFGLHPWGYHLTSILLHTLNTILVFLLLRRLIGLRGEAPAAQAGTLWRSAVVAALFGWHPLHVESVAWVAERKDVLSTLFFLLSLLAYAGYAQGTERRAESGEGGANGKHSTFNPSSVAALRRVDIQHPTSNTQHPTSIGGQGPISDLRSPTSDRRPIFPLPSSLFYLLSLTCFALGLMSKAMLVTLPFVLLLLDYWPLGRFPLSALRSPLSVLRTPLLWRLVLEKLPFFALAAISCAVTIQMQKHGGAVMPTEILPPGARVENALISYCRYLGKIFWPTDLAIFYPHPGYWPLEEVLLAAVFLSGVSMFFFLQRNRNPILLLGWLWFLGTLMPVIGLVQVGEQAMADRYTYIPSLGVFLLTVWGADALWRSWRHRGVNRPHGGAAVSAAGSGGVSPPVPSPSRTLGKPKSGTPALNGPPEGWRLIALTGTVAAVLASCCLLTRQQLGYWQNSESLFRHAVAVTKNSSWAFNNLGFAVFNHGQIDEAISDYQQAVRFLPGNAENHNNLGIALLAKDRIDEAIAESQEALRLKPNYASAHVNLGNAFSKQGRLDEAIAQFQESVHLEPDDATGRFNLGVALLNRGRLEEAINEFHAALQLKPAAADVHNNLGIALLAKGLTDEAIAESQEALRLKPDFALAYLNLGSAFFRQGRLDEAIAQFQEVARLEPHNVTGHVNLGVALLNQHRLDEAIAELLNAIRLKSDVSDAHYNLGVAYLKKGQFDEAISQFQEGLHLKPEDTDAQRDLARAVELKRRLGTQTPDPGALNNLAWQLATSPDAKLRDGTRAVKLAELACQQTQYQQTIMVGTLAAAYAEAGRFDDATAAAQKACVLAGQRGETNLLTRNQELLALYQKHQPYHEPGSAPANPAAH